MKIRKKIKNKNLKSRKKSGFPIKYLIFFIISISIFYGAAKTIFGISLSIFSKSKTILKNSSYLNKYEIINEYLSSIPKKYQIPKTLERERLLKYFSLKVLSKNINDPSNKEVKSELLRKFRELSYNKNYSSLKAIFVLEPVSFGNGLVKLNNLIYYCEIFGYKNIYLNSKYNWFLKNKIITEKINITIIDSSEVDCNDRNILCFTLRGALNVLLYPINLKVEIRINILKDEIKRNLPQVKTEKDELYIHIRSGDIFTWNFNPFYSQPPLCFYQKILYNFHFKKVYIIADENNNPVINKLIEEFQNVIYKKNSLEVDIATLSNAYNIVGSISSFLQGIIKINDNLENYWEYDIYRISEKFGHLHVDIYDIHRKFIIYKMKPSEKYKNEMFVWTKDENKLKLMIEEKCIYNFIIIDPNIPINKF